MNSIEKAPQAYLGGRSDFPTHIQSKYLTQKRKMVRAKVTRHQNKDIMKGEGTVRKEILNHIASGSLESDETEQRQSQQSLLYINDGENNGSPDINHTFDQRQKIKDRNRARKQRKAK